MQNKKIFIFFIVLIFTIGQIATDIYLPALPQITNYFATNSKMAQLSIAVYIASVSIMQPIYGIASDGYGRKPSLLFGMILAFLGTFVCILAPNISIFLLGRCIQGLGAGVGTTVCRAVMRDSFSGRDLIITNSHLGVANIAFMISAPVLGGYLAYYINWQACFIFLLLIAIINIIAILFILPETSKKHGKHNLKLTGIISNFLSLLRSRNFRVYSFSSFMTFGGVIAWTTAGPILLANAYKISPIHIGWIYFFIGMMYIVGNLINRRLIYINGMNKMIRIGFSIQLSMGLILFLVYLLNIVNIFALLIPVGIYMLGASLIAPNAGIGAINDFTDISGTASALLSTTQSLGAVLFSIIIVISHNQTILPIAICFIAIGLITLLVNYIYQPQQPTL